MTRGLDPREAEARQKLAEWDALVCGGPVVHRDASGDEEWRGCCDLAPGHAGVHREGPHHIGPAHLRNVLALLDEARAPRNPNVTRDVVLPPSAPAFVLRRAVAGFALESDGGLVHVEGGAIAGMETLCGYVDTFTTWKRVRRTARITCAACCEIVDRTWTVGL